MIHILHGQTDELITDITPRNILRNKHSRSLQDNLETFEFLAPADQPYAEFLGERNKLLIDGEDGEFREFIIFDSIKRRKNKRVEAEIYSYASHLELAKAKVIDPHETESWTAERHGNEALAGTEWKIGHVDHTGIRKMTFENHTNPFAYLKRIATTFDMELRFYIETDGNVVTGRYVDILDRVGIWSGREVTFGKDLLGIRRTEKAGDIVTALKVIGPEREDGSRLVEIVEDKDALARWGRNGEHLIEVYEPETEDQDMTRARLIQLGRTELNKRIDAIIEYEADIVDLENVPGLENHAIRFGDTIRIKDEYFVPPLYLEARIHTQDRDIIDKSKKSVQLGHFIEFTEEEVFENWEKLRDELEKKIREAEERAKWRASHGSKIVAIMPLSSQKSGIDSQYKEIIDNPDLSSTIRGQLTVAKVSYDVSYDTLMTAVEAKGKLDNPTESDVQEVYGLLSSYESELDNVAELLEKATESISKNYTDDHIDEVNRELDEASRRIDEARDDINRARSDLDTAQEELDQTKIDLEDSRNRLRGTEDNLRETRDDLSKLESDLREAENSLRDKVDLVDYNERITDITRDMASKVDGEWVDGRLRVEIDGESELIYVKDDIDGMINNTVSKAKYETDQEGIVERFESAESRIYQNEQAIGGMVKQIDYNADQGRLEERLTEWERTADGFMQSVSRLQTDFDNLEIGVRNLLIGTKEMVDNLPDKITYNGTTYSIYGYAWGFLFHMDLKAGQEYTVIVPVYNPSDNETQARIYVGHRGNMYRTIPPNTEMKAVLNFTATENEPNAIVRFLTANGNLPEVAWHYPMIVEGNKAGNWQPAPEDSITYTETRIEQLADKIALEYIKDDDLIAGIRIGDPNPINGANVEITGDTAIYGRLLAPDATFIKISTEEMYAIDAEIKDSKITGKLDANEALFQKGKFEEAHLIKAKIEEADIIDADIQNATITGSLNSVGGTFTGRLEGVDGTFTGKLRGALIEGSEFISEEELGLTRRKTKVDVDGVTVEYSSTYHPANHYDFSELRDGELNLGYYDGSKVVEATYSRNKVTTRAGLNYTIESALGLRVTGSQLLFGGGADTGLKHFGSGDIERIRLHGGRPSTYLEVNHNEVRTTKPFSADRLTTVSTLEYTVNNHAYIRPRPGYELRVADVNGTWRPVKADSFPAMSSELYKTNIAPYKESALELLRESVVYDYERIATGKRELGFIIERETPEVLKYDEESINTYTLGSLAAKGIQELDQITNKRITDLEVENQMLKERVRQLETKTS